MFFDSALNGIPLGHSDPAAIVAKYAERAGQDPKLARQRFTMMREAFKPERMLALMAEGERLSKQHRPQHSIATAQQRVNDARRRHAELDHRWSTACHEAGHSIAALKRGMQVGVASIVPDAFEGHSGYMTVYGTDRASKHNYLVQLWAGPVADAVARRQSPLTAALAGADHKLANEAMAGMDGTQWFATRERARHDAIGFVQANWQAIDRVARELVVKQWLDGDTIASMMAEN